MGNNKLHSTIYLRWIGSFSDFGDILIAMFLPELSDKLSDVYTAPIGHLGHAVGNVRRVRRFSPPLHYNDEDGNNHKTDHADKYIYYVQLNETRGPFQYGPRCFIAL